MIHFTGDTHGNFNKIINYKKEKYIKAGDTLIVCGDFGGIWSGGKQENDILDNLSKMIDFNLCFVDGNHENFDLLNEMPVEIWNGGKAHKIRSNIIHLMRGEVFNIENKKIFTMGGGKSHDIKDGILNPNDEYFIEKEEKLNNANAMFRVLGRSWWPQEMPNQDDYNNAYQNLKNNNWKVDYIVTHCCPDNIQFKFSLGIYKEDELTHFLQMIMEKTSFDNWFFGHYHDNAIIYDKFYLMYDAFLDENDLKN